MRPGALASKKIVRKFPILTHDDANQLRTDYPSPGAFEDLNVADNVSGFTIPGIFQHYHPALGSLLQLKVLLEPDLQTNQTIIDLDNLFESYEPL